MIKNRVSGWLTLGRDRKPVDLLDSIRPGPGFASSTNESPERLSDAIRRSQDALLRMQNQEDGYWCGPIFGDSTVDSDTVMLLNFLGRGTSVKIRRLANHILNKQNPDGGWPIYDNGPSEISATVKGYWALKFAGHAPHEPRLEAARKRIKALGGIHRANTYTKFYLALFGQYDWRGVPTIPPEIMLFPNWFYFNLYEMSAWTRSIVVPLSIVWAFQPAIPCPAQATLDELFPDSRRYIPLSEAVAPHKLISWTTFFLVWDSFLKGMEGRGGHWIRVWALRLAEDWILERLQDSDGLGAIYPGIANSIMAMKCLGYPDTDPRLVAQLQELDRLEVPGEDSTRYQPSRSPVNAACMAWWKSSHHCACRPWPCCSRLRTMRGSFDRLSAKSSFCGVPGGKAVSTTRDSSSNQCVAVLSWIELTASRRRPSRCRSRSQYIAF